MLTSASSTLSSSLSSPNLLEGCMAVPPSLTLSVLCTGCAEFRDHVVSLGERAEAVWHGGGSRLGRARVGRRRLDPFGPGSRDCLPAAAVGAGLTAPSHLAGSSAASVSASHLAPSIGQ